MSDVNDGVENSDQADEANFNAGFNDTPTETPGEVEAEQKQPEPKYRQITEDEFTSLSASAAQVEEMRATLSKQTDTIYGKIGGLERVLKQYQEQTPAGQAVEITEDDFAEMREEFGEDLSGSMLKTLQRVAGKLRGTGSAGIDEGKFNEMVSPMLEKASATIIQQAKVDLAKESLFETHPDWESVIGNLPEAKPASPEFMVWLGTQSAEYQARMTSTFSPVALGRSIDKFREHQASLKKTADKTAERQDRFEQAVTPKGDGDYEPSHDSDDNFMAGFNSG